MVRALFDDSRVHVRARIRVIDRSTWWVHAWEERKRSRDQFRGHSNFPFHHSSMLHSPTFSDQHTRESQDQGSKRRGFGHR